MAQPPHPAPPQQPPPKPPSPPKPPDGEDAGKQSQSQTQADEERNQIREERAAKAREIFDENEADAKDDDRPVTTQTDQLRRSSEMEEVGPEAWMNEQERRIRERQGDPPIEPRQVHGVAPPQRPR